MSPPGDIKAMVMHPTAGSDKPSPAIPAISIGFVIVALAILLAACTGAETEDVAVTGSDETEGAAGQRDEDGTGDSRDDSATSGDGGGSAERSGDRGGAQGEEPIRWFLPPAGPDIPDNDERFVYEVLERAEAAGCRDELSNGALSRAPPAGFDTGPRSYYLYRAGAHLCTGDVESARAALSEALGFAWLHPTDEATQGRVCRVWTAVTTSIAPGAGPCTLEVEPPPPQPPDDETDRERPGAEEDLDVPEAPNGPDQPGDPDGMDQHQDDGDLDGEPDEAP